MAGNLLVTYNPFMDDVFKALADETRRSILDRLFEEGGLTLTEISEPFLDSMSRQAVMKHLSILENSNLVAVVWSGREKRHYLNPAPIHDMQNRWIKKFDKQRVSLISALKSALEEPTEKDKKYDKSKAK